MPVTTRSQKRRGNFAIVIPPRQAPAPMATAAPVSTAVPTANPQAPQIKWTSQERATIGLLENLVGFHGGSHHGLLQATVARLRELGAKPTADKSYQEMTEIERDEIDAVIGETMPGAYWDNLGDGDKDKVMVKVVSTRLGLNG